jgi:hypothetical protein
MSVGDVSMRISISDLDDRFLAGGGSKNSSPNTAGGGLPGKRRSKAFGNCWKNAANTSPSQFVRN